MQCRINGVTDMNIVDIDAQIAALEAARKQAIVDANDAARPAFAAIVVEYEWRVTWNDAHGLTIDCRQTDATVAAYEAWKAAYPLSSVALPRDLGKWHGMRHVLVGNVLISAWGGSVILNIARDYEKDWHELTEEQAVALRAGIVPEDIRKPW
jgi:acyl-CoA-binding protein